MRAAAYKTAPSAKAPGEPALAVRAISDGADLVGQLAPDSLYFVLQTQFLTLQFRDFEVIGGWPRQLFFDFPI